MQALTPFLASFMVFSCLLQIQFPPHPRVLCYPQRLPCLLAYFLNPPHPIQGPSGPQSPVISSVLQNRDMLSLQGLSPQSPILSNVLQNPDVVSLQNMQELKLPLRWLYSETEIN